MKWGYILIYLVLCEVDSGAYKYLKLQSRTRLSLTKHTKSWEARGKASQEDVVSGNLQKMVSSSAFAMRLK